MRRRAASKLCGGAIVDDLGLPHEALPRSSPTARWRRSPPYAGRSARRARSFVTTDPGWKWPMQFARQAGARGARDPDL